MQVIAPAGKICPKERSRERIGSQTAVDVPDTNYYRSRVAEGSLLVVEDVGAGLKPGTTGSDATEVSAKPKTGGKN